jgi:signal transduction histidine kinase/ActR/RegA family two-component response regulator
MNPILVYYNILFVISVILLFLLVMRWQVQLDIDMAVLFTLVPITLIGYIKLANSDNISTAIFANQIVYLGGCFLQLLIFLVVCTLCHIRLFRFVRFFLFGLAIVLYCFVLGMGRNMYFYESISLGKEYGVSVLHKEYGIVHTIFYCVLVMYVLLTLVMVFYAYRTKKDVSNKNMSIVATTIVVSTLLFLGGKRITDAIEFTPFSYILSEIAFLAIAYRIRLYSISGDIASNVLEGGEDGLICLDLKKKLLVYNKAAVKMIPDIADMKVDKELDEGNEIFKKINVCIEDLSAGRSGYDILFNNDGYVYRAKPEFLRDHRKKCGYYVLISDVTSEHRYIERMNKYNEELQEARDKAEAADAAKTQFLAQMSHEIRTPINAVLGMNEMIMQETDDEVILDYAEGISSSGQNLLFLINSILDFSKIEDGKMEIIEEEYDTVALIMNLVGSMSSRAEAKNLKFEVKVDRNLPVKLIGDDVRISQVILNLLSNAVKYTDEGMVALSIEAKEGLSDHNAFEDNVDGSDTEGTNNRIRNGEVVLHVEVKDTGIGIRTEDMGKLFDEFSRLDQAKNHRVEGTGLGMPIIYNLLKLMGSEIHVESEYGKGSVFWFDLKQSVADKTPVGDYKEKVRIANTRAKQEITLYAPEAKILVVDDNALNIKVTRGYLKICGIIPDEAMSGAEAIELIKKNTYDVVLLDHMMPGMDGIETLFAIRKENLAPKSTVFVVLTANAIEGSREMYMEAGFDDYISKPVELKTLTNKLEGYLEKTENV